MGVVDHAKNLHSTAVDRLHSRRVVFHHVPKCGGTSVGRALRKRYLLSEATVDPESSFRAYQAFTGSADRESLLVDILDFREQMLLYLMYQDVRCVSAHVRFSDVAYARFKDRYRFITILREPISRFISHYHWNSRMTDDHGHFDLPFEEFLETGRALRYGAMYVEYFSGLPKEADIRSQEAVDAAVENLGKFDVIGYLDNLQAFQAAIKDVLSVRIRIGHENRLRKNEQTGSTVMTPAIRARVKEICAPDTEIWQRVRGA